MNNTWKKIPCRFIYTRTCIILVVGLKNECISPGLCGCPSTRFHVQIEIGQTWNFYDKNSQIRILDGSNYRGYVEVLVGSNCLEDM